MTTERTWVQTIFQPLVVATMMASIAVSVVQLVQLLVPTWSGVYLTLIVFLAALEAPAASRLVRRYRLRGREHLMFRAGEWVLILVALKLGSYAMRGVDALIADMALWQESILNLLTIEYLVAVFLTLFTWAMATDIERDLTELGKPARGVRVNRDAIHDQLLSKFFWGGLFLLIAAGITRIGVGAMLNLAHPPVTGVILNALLYFVLGLVLLSQAQLTILRTRWRTQDIPIAADVSTRWSRTSIAFVVLVAVVALILPTSYSHGLLESLGLILTVIIQVINFLVGLLLFLVMLPFALLMEALSGGGAPLSAPTAPPPPPLLPPQEAQDQSWWTILRSLLFWGLMLGIAGYALRSYLGYRGDLVEGLRGSAWLGRLWAFLSGLWRQTRDAAAGAVEPIRRRLARVAPERPGGRGLWPWRRLSSMSPRERVQYYYLSVVHRGDKVGRPRRESETPHEYSSALRHRKPEVEPDLTELTEAFIEARYSRHDIPDEQAGVLRESWNRIKRALRS